MDWLNGLIKLLDGHSPTIVCLCAYSIPLAVMALIYVVSAAMRAGSDND